MHQPDNATPWALLVASQGSFLVAGVAAYTTQVIWGWTDYPNVVDLVNLLFVYPTVIAAAILFVRDRSASWHLPTLLDLAVMSTAAVMLSWIYLINPTYMVAGAGWLAKLFGMVYPILDLVLLTLTLRLSLGLGRRVPSYYLLIGYASVYLVTDTVYLLQRLDNSYTIITSWITTLGYCACAILLTISALHPSMVQMGEVGDSAHSEPTRRRLLTLTLAALIAPAVLAVQSVRGEGGFRSGLVIAAACAVMFLLVMARMSGLISTQRSAAVTDTLTGLFNRRFLEPALRNEGARALRSDGSLGVAMVDVDHFKSVNDTYGHSAGDKVLAEVAAGALGLPRIYGHRLAVRRRGVLGAAAEHRGAAVAGRGGADRGHGLGDPGPAGTPTPSCA